MKAIFIHPSFKEVYKKHPITLIDVGASGGIPRLWKCAEKYLQVVGFEPDARAFEELKGMAGGTQKFVNAALYSSNGTIAFNLTKKQQCSSIFTPNASFLEQFPDAERCEVIGSIDVKTRRLSKELLLNEDIHDADFLKVDTQGEDLHVLKGATEVLDDFIFGVNVEVEFTSIYKDQPLFPDVDIFLRDHGFQLFDMKRYYWKRKIGKDACNVKGQLVFADALYFKTYEAFLNAVRTMDGTWQKAKVLKALSICLIYNKVDYAIYLCDKAASDNIFSGFERDLIFKAIYRRRGGINFKSRHRLASLLRKLYLYLKSDEFHFADEELGNE